MSHAQVNPNTESAYEKKLRFANAPKFIAKAGNTEIWRKPGKVALVQDKGFRNDAKDESVIELSLVQARQIIDALTEATTEDEDRPA